MSTFVPTDVLCMIFKLGQIVRRKKVLCLFVCLATASIKIIYFIDVILFCFFSSFLASTNVELAVKRSQKLVRPTSVGIVPSTPVLSGRDRTASITGPQPVDSIKRREMETYKIQTLQKMLEQEKLNLERLKGDTNNPSYKLSEANIKRLREQLRQVGAEDTTPTTPNSNSTKFQQTSTNTTTAISNINQKNSTHLSPNQINHLSAMSTGNYHHSNHNNHQQQQQQQATTPQTHSSQAFLSLLPRSLSSLSLGTRKNKIDKDLITTPTTTFTQLNSNTMDFLNISSNLNSTTTTTTNSTPTTNLFLPMSVSLNQTTQLQQQHLFNRNSNLSQQQQQQQQRGKETPTKSANGKNAKKHNSSFAAQIKNFIEEDIPPPLPQRNPPRTQIAADNFNNNNNNNNNNTPISDLDLLTGGSPQRNSPQPTAPLAASATAAQKKRAKTKTKALSDPKMSTQIFLQMETATAATTTTGCAALEVNVCGESEELDCVPPPLPPRQPGMLEEVIALKGSIQNLQHHTHHHGVMGVSSVQRAAPNSLDTQMNYPLVATCTPVHRDNLAAAFPLSQRPNIVQQLQQHQQQQAAVSKHS